MTEAENSMYAVQMTLVIRKLQKSDMGGYKCISKNSIGDAEGTIRIYGELYLFQLLVNILTTLYCHVTSIVVVIFCNQIVWEFPHNSLCSNYHVVVLLKVPWEFQNAFIDEIQAKISLDGMFHEVKVS